MLRPRLELDTKKIKTFDIIDKQFISCYKSLPSLNNIEIKLKVNTNLQAILIKEFFLLQKCCFNFNTPDLFCINLRKTLMYIYLELILISLKRVTSIKNLPILLVRLFEFNLVSIFFPHIMNTLNLNLKYSYNELKLIFNFVVNKKTLL